MQGLHFFRLFTRSDNDRARAFFRKSIELDPNCTIGLVWLAWVYWSDARFHWDATATLAMTLNWCGRPEEASELVKKAMRLSPIHSTWYLSVLAHAHRLMLRYDEAIEVYKQAIALAPNQIAAHLGLTICYAKPAKRSSRACKGRRFCASRRNSTWPNTPSP